MAKTKRPSGGARDVEAKHAEREAARGRPDAYARSWRRRYKALGRRPKEAEAAHVWLASVAVLNVEEAMLDPGPPPEQRREQVGRLVEKACKALDPAKLAARISRLEEALEEMLLERQQRQGKQEPHAGDVESGEAGPT
jgi:hypothetical protein